MSNTLPTDERVTTMRTYLRQYAPNAEISFWPERWLDEPVIVSSPGNLWCSGKALVRFDYQPDRAPRFRTVRPAYLVHNDDPNYGTVGLRLVQSA